MGSIETQQKVVGQEGAQTLSNKAIRQRTRREKGTGAAGAIKLRAESKESMGRRAPESAVWKKW